MEILHHSLLGNSLLQWAVATGVLIVSVSVLRLVQAIVGRRLAALAARTENRWDDVIAELVAKTKFLFLVILGTVVGAQFLELSDRIRPVLYDVLAVSLFIQAGIWSSSLVMSLVESYHRQLQQRDPAAMTSIHLLGLMGKTVVWSAVFLLVLDNFGVNISSLIAGLGIGGIAVALAVQNVLGDLFASLSIVLDKPFVNKDFLIIDDLMGSVEHIGLKTTRVRSLSGEQLIFSNSDLLKSRIRNYGRMFERRVVFTIGVTYQTSRSKLKRIPVFIRAAVEAEQQTRFDRCHFMQYGAYALQFETVYYVLSPDYNVYMDIQQAIYFTIHERFEEEGIAFAYPTQTVLVAQEARPAQARAEVDRGPSG